jgi:hypothetical protein
MIRIYKGEDSVVRVDAGSTYAPLASFLEQDVQSSIRFTDELLEAVNQIRCGGQASWEGTGNAHTVSISKSRVRIRNEFNEGWCDLSIDEFAESLMQWRNWIRSQGNK